MANKYNAGQYIFIYKNFESMSIDELSRILGINKGYVHTMYVMVRNHLAKETLSTKVSHEMRKAIEILKSEKDTPSIAETQSVSEVKDPITELEKAFESLKQTIVEVVISEAQRRTEQLIAEKDEELKRQKELHEKEFRLKEDELQSKEDELNQIRGQMKASNIAAMIRKGFNIAR